MWKFLLASLLLADPLLARECAAALEDLARILGLPGLYDLD